LIVRRSILYPPGSDFFARIVRRQFEERKLNSLARNEQSDCAGNSAHHQKVITAQQDLPQPQFRTSSARPRPVRYGLKAWRSTISGRLPRIPWSHVV